MNCGKGSADVLMDQRSQLLLPIRPPTATHCGAEVAITRATPPPVLGVLTMTFKPFFSFNDSHQSNLGEPIVIARLECLTVPLSPHDHWIPCGVPQWRGTIEFMMSAIIVVFLDHPNIWKGFYDRSSVLAHGGLLEGSGICRQIHGPPSRATSRNKIISVRTQDWRECFLVTRSRTTFWAEVCAACGTVIINHRSSRGLEPKFYQRLGLCRCHFNAMNVVGNLWHDRLASSRQVETW